MQIVDKKLDKKICNLICATRTVFTKNNQKAKLEVILF